MSLQETYQSRKKLIANNLTQMGVSASENEGLTTLANKILLIESKVDVNITWTLNGVSEADSVILSHKDNENAVFVFTVTDENDDPISGYPIPLSVDGTAISPVPITNNQGQATYTYESQGIGDVSIDVNCGTFLTKTFVVEDCWRANLLTSNDNLFTCNNSNCNCSYSSNGLYGSASNTSQYLLNTLPTGDFSVEFEIVALSSTSNDYCGSLIFGGVYILPHLSNGYQIRRLDESAQSWITPKLAVGDIVKADMENGTVKVYVNDVLKGSKSIQTLSATGLYLTTSGRTITVKNLKIKPL